ncbi:hypothetical protein WMF04_45570 [Sorangium sp. So ce260]|uniref:hypothetical protein n=1 Tax=Sorangium sp. So ce260 TaxID=3133291 RepID=UPI003F627783
MDPIEALRDAAFALEERISALVAVLCVKREPRAGASRAARREWRAVTRSRAAAAASEGVLE